MKNVKLYVIVTNSLLTILILTVIGYYLGAKWWLHDDIWGGIFAIIGSLMGIAIFIYNVLYYNKKEGDSNQKNKSNN